MSSNFRQDPATRTPIPRHRPARLLSGWQLMVSSALTYDRHGHCIEGAGIPVNRPITPAPLAPDAPDLALLAADQEW